jgi:hypothetical protein
LRQRRCARRARVRATSRCGTTCPSPTTPRTCARGRTSTTIDGPRKFAQQLTLSHDGRPFLIHESRSWLLDDDGNVIRPAARETGFWRPQADDTIELLLTHNTGIVELYYGKPRNQTSWELGTDAVIRTATAKDVTAAQRLYGLIEGSLGYVEERAMMGQEMQPHTSAMLRRIVG